MRAAEAVASPEELYHWILELPIPLGRPHAFPEACKGRRAFQGRFQIRTIYIRRDSKSSWTISIHDSESGAAKPDRDDIEVLCLLEWHALCSFHIVSSHNRSSLIDPVSFSPLEILDSDQHIQSRDYCIRVFVFHVFPFTH